MYTMKMKMNTSVVGLDIGRHHITASRVVEKGGQYYPTVIAEAGVPAEAFTEQGDLVRPDLIADTIKKTWSDYKVKTKKVIVSIPSDRLFFYPVSRPQQIQGGDLVSSLQLEMNPLLPFPAERAQIGSITTGDDGIGNNTMLAFACDGLVPTTIRDQIVKKAGLQFQSALPEALMLPQCVNIGLTEEPEALLHIGAYTSVFLIVKGGVVQYAQTISIGGHHFTQELVEQLGYPDAEAEMFKRRNSLIGPLQGDPNIGERQALVSMADQMVEQMYSIVTYAASIGLPLRRMMLSGGGARLNGLMSHFNTSLGYAIEPAQPRPEIIIEKPDLFPRHVASLSLLVEA